MRCHPLFVDALRTDDVVVAAIHAAHHRVVRVECSGVRVQVRGVEERW